MATTALIAVGVLSLLVFVLFGALMESLRDVRQIRDALGILDRPLDVDIGAAVGTAPSSIPPRHWTTPTALVLFLSDAVCDCRIPARWGACPRPMDVIEAVSSQARQSSSRRMA
jgi:hypothetical protein